MLLTVVVVAAAMVAVVVGLVVVVGPLLNAAAMRRPASWPHESLQIEQSTLANVGWASL